MATPASAPEIICYGNKNQPLENLFLFTVTAQVGHKKANYD